MARSGRCWFRYCWASRECSATWSWWLPDAWERRGRVGRNASNKIQSFFLRTSPPNDTAPSGPRERPASRYPLDRVHNGPLPGACTGGEEPDISGEVEVILFPKTHGCPFSYKAFHGITINP